MSNASSHEDEKTSQIRTAIAKTRADMGGTIEELHGRLNPTVLKEQALEQFHEAKETVKSELKAELQNVKSELKAEIADAKAAVREATIGKVEHMVHTAQDTVKATGSSIVNAISENPIPAALAGIGLAWLFVSARSAKTQRATAARGYAGPVSQGAHDGALGKAAHQLGETAGNVALSLQHTATNIAHQTAQLAEQAGSSIGQAAHQAQAQAVRVERRVEETYHANPIAVGMAVLALGTAVGIAIPITRREEELMGGARDQVFGKAKEVAHHALDQVEHAVKEGDNDASHA